MGMTLGSVMFFFVSSLETRSRFISGFGMGFQGGKQTIHQSLDSIHGDCIRGFLRFPFLEELLFELIHLRLGFSLSRSDGDNFVLRVPE